MPPEKSVFVPADDPRLAWTGRFAFSEKSVYFDWPGVFVRLAYEGEAPLLDFQDDAQEYNIEIDGVFQEKLVTKKGTGPYRVKNASRGRHEWRIARRIEADHGTSVFRGVFLQQGTKLLKAPRSPNRRLEFIGDSLSAGYGNEGPGVNCDDLKKYQNNDLAFPALVARALKADYHVIAVSGRGIVRNYGDAKPFSRDPLPYYYERTLKKRPDLPWDFSKFIPDAVVIFLGNNDLSTDPKPAKEDFQKAYLMFLKSLREKYPNAFFLCLSRPEYPAFSPWVEEIVREAQEEHGGEIGHLVLDAFRDGDWGCDYHPRAAEHARIAERVRAALARVLHWE